MKKFGTLVLFFLIRVDPDWVTGEAPDVQGKDGEKHHVHSALNPAFAAEEEWKSIDG